ncbi:hypothetical protein [Fictibacillus fluitans]|uniref:Bacterial Ig domain-containing protein n=1 Tax=Fictibacillus fluitans TaxID=3058422 RepID=A0ABT8I052_9BACL|nr:hypothetical protein [Fictibacillus sp. NE201]MDN4526404.1 hypothetical protein [Fictibacillus sp. NE201]
MRKDNSCICEFLKNVKRGQAITVITNQGDSITFIFIKIKGTCVFGELSNGAIVEFDCNDVEAIFFPPTPTPPPAGCLVSLFVEAEIQCEDFINGEVICNGSPVPFTPVFLASSPGLINFAQNPVFTNANGQFTVNVTVPAPTPETPVTVSAVAVNGTATGVSTTIASCPSSLCVLDIFGPEGGTFDCAGPLNGRLVCDGVPVPGVPITITQNPPGTFIIDPSSTFTDSEGNFESGINLAPGTSGTATITVLADGFASDSITVSGTCTQLCDITATVTPVSACTYTISGFVTCGGVGQEGDVVTFTTFPGMGMSIPPATTDATGFYSSTFTVPPGTSITSVLVTATTQEGGQTLTTEVGAVVSCPAPTECPCKFQLGVGGFGAPATANVINGGVPSTISGTINVSIVQCYIGGPGCNPAVNNFSITFSGGSFVFNLTQGRRIRFSCNDSISVQFEGTAQATGTSTLQGLFDVFLTATISGNTITWTINATNDVGDSFSTTFTSAVTPQTFIGDCSQF